MKDNLEKPNKIHHIRDYRVIKDQALEEGYSLGEYLSKAKQLGISREELIDCSYNRETLDNIIENKTKRQKFRNRIASAIAIPIIAYASNFGIMTGIAEIQTPNGFHEQYSEYTESKKILKDLEKNGKFMVSGQYVIAAQELLGEKYYKTLAFGPIAWQFENTKAKAINPLKHI